MVVYIKNKIFFPDYCLLFLFLLLSVVPVKAGYVVSKVENLENGLSNSSVLCMHQDRRGFIWAGTYDGLNRYDGLDVQVYRFEYGNKYSLSSNIMHGISDADNNCLWVNTFLGVDKFSLDTKKVVESYPQFRDSSVLVSDKNGNAWVITRKNHISYYNPELHQFREISLPGIIPERIKTIFIDDYNTLWIFGADNRILKVNYSFKKGYDPEDIELNVRNIALHDKNTQYAFYDDGIIYFIDSLNKLYSFNIEHHKKTFIKDVSELVNKYGIISSILSCDGDILISFKSNGVLKLLSDNNYRVEFVNMNIGVFSMRKDKRQNIIWLCTDGQGILMYHNSSDLYRNIMLDQLPYSINKPVRSIYTDENGDLWLGTKGDGIIRISKYDRIGKGKIPVSQVSYYTTENGLSSDQVFGILRSRYRDIIWIATEGPGFSYFSNKDSRMHSLINHTGKEIKWVHSVYEENDSVLWMSTAGMGLLRIVVEGRPPDISVKSVRRFLFYKSGNLCSEFFSMSYDGHNTLWLGSRGGYGVIRFNIRTYDYDFVSNDISAIGDVICVYQSRDSVFYFGASSGLSKVWVDENGKQQAQQFDRKDGILNDMIHGILEDDNGCIWMGTNKGLVKYNPKNNFFHNYFKYGTDVVEFCDDAYYRCPYSGRLFFGGVNGVAWVEHDEKVNQDFLPEFYFTGLEVRGEDRNLFDFIKKEKGTLVLPFSDNSFSVSFVALDYIDGKHYEYYYKLENFDSHWMSTQKVNEASFTNLPAGHYILKVKYKNDVYDSEDKFFSLPITILSPWYCSPWAYVAYIIIFLLICSGVIYVGMRKIKQRQTAIANKLKEEQREKLFQEKIDFFTNITHEFCTPLTLINGFCERIMTYEKTDKKIREYVSMLQSNSRYLNDLVQEIIDFRKIEEGGHIERHIRRVSIAELVNRWVLPYNEVASLNGIEFITKVPEDLYWNTDTSCLGKIVVNLLSNAFKYTPRNGKISILAEIRDSELKIIVHNTGNGIEADKLSTLFDRYNILENMDRNAYTDMTSRNGLGLSICHGMTDLLDGNISVRSVVGEYAEFEVSLPELQVDDDNNEESTVMSAISAIQQPQISDLEVIKTGIDPDKPLVLAVDDNKEIIWLIEDILKDEYTVLKANNADEAFSILEKQTPDLIITDVLMPGIDGLELVRRIRSNKYTKYIPLIIVSAKVTDQDQTDGLKMGADAYLTKPFSSAVLYSMVNRLISNKKGLKDYFSSRESAYEMTDGILVHQEDKDFLDAVIKVINENLDEESLRPETVAEKMGMNTRSLYRKFKKVSSLSPSDFIKDYRFSYAAKLLLTTNLSVQEIIYKVGMSNKSYFYREFFKKYNMTPREYRLKV